MIMCGLHLIHFVSTANGALLCGAKIDLIDIDLKTYNLDVEKLENKLKSAKKNNKLPKIVIPVHFGGNPCEMKKFINFLVNINLKLLKMLHMLSDQFMKKMKLEIVNFQI